MVGRDAGKATAMDIRQILGPVEEETMVEILRIGPTNAQLLLAFEVASAEVEPAERSGALSDPVVNELVEILTPPEPDSTSEEL